METSIASPPSDEVPRRVLPTDAQHWFVFWNWCLQREALRDDPTLKVITLLALVGASLWILACRFWYPNLGRDFLQFLAVIAYLMIVVGGVFHVAKAFCWEVSPDLREMIRLTGISPVTLLCCKSLSRWWTVWCSVLMLIPLVCLAKTLGGVTTAQLWTSAWMLLMLTAVTAAMALVAGVSSTDVDNAETTAMWSTVLLLVIYNLFFVACAMMLRRFVMGSMPMAAGSLWGSIYVLVVQSTPIVVVVLAESDPSGFSPLAPSFWIHFLTLPLAFRFASVVMTRRFRSIRSPADVTTKSMTTTPRSIRPRLKVESPLFWKDAYILVGFRARRGFDVLYGLITLLIWGVGIASANQDLKPIGVIAIILFPVLFSVRFDAIFAAEFKQRTWEDLMVLPIDRRTLFWSKVQAVAWEQQAAILPIASAVALIGFHEPVLTLITAVIAILAGLQMCQISAYSYVTPRTWWIGPVQIGVILFAIVFDSMIWLAFERWISFLITVAAMLFALNVVQKMLDHSLETWPEQD